MITKFIKLAASLAFVTFFIASCKESANTNKLEKVRVGYIPIPHCAILFDKDEFAKEGLELELSPTDGGGTLVNAIVSGGLDFGFSNLVSPMLANDKNLSLKVTGPYTFETEATPEHGLLVLRDSGIKSVADLKGKRIAVNTFNNIDHLLLKAYLDGAGMSEKDYSIREIPFPNMLTALQRKQVDAVAAVEPFVSLAGDNIVNIGNYFLSLGKNEIDVTGYIYSPKHLAGRSGTIDRFSRAAYASARKLEQNPERFRKQILEHTKTPDTVINEINLPKYKEKANKLSLEKLMMKAKQYNFIGKPLDLEKLFDSLETGEEKK